MCCAALPLQHAETADVGSLPASRAAAHNVMAAAAAIAVNSAQALLAPRQVLDMPAGFMLASV